MLKFVRKDEPSKVVMTESDDGEITIFDKKLKEEKECQTESKSTE